MRSLFLLFGLVLCGCTASTGKNEEPVEVSGRITHNNKPVSGVTVNFQPTGRGAQASNSVKDGNYKVTITPGKYTYYLTEGSNNTNAIPEKYRAGSLERQVEITSAQTLNLDLE